jgi:hypothetical protein
MATCVIFYLRFYFFSFYSYFLLGPKLSYSEFCPGHASEDTETKLNFQVSVLFLLAAGVRVMNLLTMTPIGTCECQQVDRT